MERIAERGALATLAPIWPCRAAEPAINIILTTRCPPSSGSA
jgi:hypothetical protein